MTKISIITVSYNSASTIRDTIDSVLGQHYSDIEYIIIDGLSSDGTQNIVNSYGNKITKFVSEKDKGLYDAMNKGIDMATGDIVGILNSDDLYSSNNILARIADVFRDPAIGVVYGDLYYFKSGAPDTPKRIYKGGEFSLRRVVYGLMPPHPTFFIRRDLYKKFGKFDTQYTLSADFDLILRFLGVHKVRFKYIPEILVKMRLGGASTSSLKRTMIMNQEDIRSCKTHGLNTNLLKFYSKYFVKLIDLQ